MGVVGACLGEPVEVCSPVEVRLELPRGESSWLGVRDGLGVSGAVSTEHRSLAAARAYAEKVLAVACGTDTVERDEDGDHGSVPIYDTLLAGQPHLLHLFAIAASVGESPELLSELNALNASLPFVKLFARSTTVLACADLT